MISRVFDSESHARFIELSRDRNPIHTDPVAARRTQAGAPIVFGIHSLLCLLEECVAEQGAQLPEPTSLKAQFRKPIYLGDAAEMEASRATAEALRARIRVDDTEVVTASVGFTQKQSSVPSIGSISGPMISPGEVPRDLRIEEMEGLSGCLSFAGSLEQIRATFPRAAGYFGASQIGALVCCSCVVGMIVPGLHSLFAALDISFVRGAERSDTLHFAVTWVEPRFRRVRIGIHGGGLRGVLETMVRPPPVSQPTTKSVAALVRKDEFRGSTALIVGGSRGLGELTAKLIAAGGGRVIITYATGKVDAQAVAEEINNAGGECASIPYDVRAPAADQLSPLCARAPTHAYYFATPAIGRRKALPFDLRRFNDFNDFYVTAFLDLVRACLQLRPEGVKVFYPSTVFVETRPDDMTEYAMSKAAAELLCADMPKYLPGAQVVLRRLPRLLTDQTSALLNSSALDPMDVLLPIVREMHA
jgi:acyl dehydratase